MKFLQWAFPSFITFGRWFDRTHTATGKICTATLLAGFALLFASRPVAVDLLSAFAVLALASAAAHVANRPRCTAALQGIPCTTCGSSTAVEIVITSLRSLPVHQLTCDFEAESWMMQPVVCESSTQAVLNGKAHWRLQCSIKPLRRGVFSGPIPVIHSTFPFNLFRCTHRVPISGELVVYPYRPPQSPRWLTDYLTDSCRGETADVRVGGMGEFAGNCEYRLGMPVRRWDYRSWARLARPIVHQYDDSTNSKIALFIDSVEGAASFEKMLSLAATIIDTCEVQSIAITQIRATARIIATDESQALTTQQCLEALARLELSAKLPHDPFLPSNLALEDNTFVLLLLSDWNASRELACADLARLTDRWAGFLLVDEDSNGISGLPAEVIPVPWTLPSFSEAEASAGSEAL